MVANSAAQFDTLSQTPVQLKATPGTLFAYDVGNSDASPAMVLFYDKVTPPVYNIDTPLLRVLVPPGMNAFRTSTSGIAFSTGLYVLVKTLHGTQQRNISGHIEFV
ncbi:MAG: hypothetical protein ACREDT_12750 [Methylocella sp.]